MHVANQNFHSPQISGNNSRHLGRDSFQTAIDFTGNLKRLAFNFDLGGKSRL